VHQTPPDFQIGKAIEVRHGTDITLISTGGMLDLTMKASDELSRQGYSAQVLSMPTIEPLDHSALTQAALHTRRLITVEEHGPGGLGSAVAEVLAEAGTATRFIPLRLRREAATTAGSQGTLRSAHGLHLDGIVRAAITLL
jgi:transketolase